MTLIVLPNKPYRVICEATPTPPFGFNDDGAQATRLFEHKHEAMQFAEARWLDLQTKKISVHQFDGQRYVELRTLLRRPKGAGIVPSRPRLVSSRAGSVTSRARAWHRAELRVVS